MAIKGEITGRRDGKQNYIMQVGEENRGVTLSKSDTRMYIAGQMAATDHVKLSDKNDNFAFAMPRCWWRVEDYPGLRYAERNAMGVLYPFTRAFFDKASSLALEIRKREDAGLFSVAAGFTSNARAGSALNSGAYAVLYIPDAYLEEDLGLGLDPRLNEVKFVIPNDLRTAAHYIIVAAGLGISSVVSENHQEELKLLEKVISDHGLPATISFLPTYPTSNIAGKVMETIDAKIASEAAEIARRRGLPW